MRTARLIAGLSLATGLLAVPGVGRASATPGACSAGQYTYETIDFPGAGATQPRDINDGGVVVGSYGAGTSAVRGLDVLHGFTLAAGTWSTVDFHVGSVVDPSTYVTGINDAGSLSGFSGRFDQAGFALTPLTGVRRIGGVDSVVAAPSGVNFANGISAAGDVGGFWVDGAGGPHGYLDHGATAEAVDHPGALATYVAGVGDDGSAVGLAVGLATGPATRPFIRHTDGSFEDVVAPCGTISALEDRADDGEVVGSIQASSGGVHGIVRRPGGSFWVLDVPGADATRGYGINAAGVVVGEYDLGGAIHGFIATPYRRATQLVAEPVVLRVSGALVVRITVGQLSARLTDSASGAPIAGAPVTFRAGGTVLCSATTGADGRAYCSGLSPTLASLLALGFQASYGGTDEQAPAAANGSLVVVGGLRLF